MLAQALYMLAQAWAGAGTGVA